MEFETTIGAQAPGMRNAESFAYSEGCVRILDTVRSETECLLTPRNGIASEEATLEWCSAGWKSAVGTLGGLPLLRDAFYEKHDFWKSLAVWSDRLSKEALVEIWGMPPFERGVAKYRLKRAGYPHASPKNCLLRYGLLSSEEAVFVDDRWFLNAVGLKKWYFEGYEFDGVRKTGREILSYAQESGFFWEYLKRYAQNLKHGESTAIGGKFPGHNRSIAERVGHVGSVSMGTFLAWIAESEISETTERTSARPGFMNDSALVRWYFEGYLDAKGERAYGKDVVAKAAESDDFFWYMKSYQSGLDRNTVIRMGGLPPASDSGYRDRLKSVGFERIDGENIQRWFERGHGMAIREFSEQNASKSTLPAAEGESPIPDDPVLRAVLRKIRGKLAETANDARGWRIKKGSISHTAFDAKLKNGKIVLSAKREYVKNTLRPYRKYVEEGIIDEWSAGLEFLFEFDWS